MAVSKTKGTRDDAIIETNSSCIISKRSVERIYYKQEQGFLNFFVSNFQRRSPLINRGYWLRMKAIDFVVRSFLSESSEKRKILVNLGAGFDPLAFTFLAEEPELCKNASFVDVDYRKLIQKKCDKIRSSRALYTCVTEVESKHRDVLLQSPQYCALACDLDYISGLDVLKTLFDLDKCSIMFVAEVSMTYMNTQAADAVIEWTSKFQDCKFSMLEQYLPGSLEHPFAQTMLKHFEKLRSPLKAAIEFSSLQNQRSRFTEYPAWADVQALNLWQLWSQDCLLSPSDRAQLDHVEPFDEWEEFALFASHYFLLVAQTASASKIVLDYPVTEHEQLSGQKSSCTAPIPFSSTYNENPNQLGQRRFGASLKVNHDHVLHVAGHSSSPLKTCDHYLVPSNDDEEEAAQPHIQVQNLLLGMNVMCPSITHIGNGNKLFVGGRVSPDHASARCFACDDNQAWREVQSLPHGLYRHSSVQVDDSMVLIFGGKCNGWEISAEWLYWHRKHGWQSIEIGGERAEPRFGASIICVRTSQAISQGYLTGGIGRHGVVLTDFWHWKFYPSTSSNKARLELTDLTVRFQGNKHESQLGRFGAQMIYSGSEIYLIGGVTRHGLVQQDCEIMVIRPEAGQIQATDCHPGPRPLLIGFSAEPLTENAFVIVGGAATCFSFGTYWNRGCYTFCDKVNQAGSERRGYQLATSASLDSPKKASLGTPLPGFMTNKTKEHTQIKRMKISSESDFSRIMEVNLPTVLWGLDFGSCIEKWNDSYLEEQIGVERLVTVHSAQSNKMDFVAKNFTYDRMTFGKFLKDIAIGEKKYLRAVSADKPAEMVTTLSKDFPELANDFQLPPALAFVTANSHSSPLRISGPVKMWLHYDVMANVLCQIRGSKRLILYHPRDVTALGFAPGSSSSQFDPFEADSLGTTNSRSKISSYEAHLRPGDVLFIPPLWPHTAQPIGTTSVAVNVFFKNMDTGYAAGRDTYGNRDLQAYENGRRDIQKILKAQRTLPKDAAIFYLQRLAAELSDAAAALDTAAP